MRYNAPPGGAADAPFLDGNRNAGIKGSVVPAAAVEHPQRELAHLISFAGLTPAASDLEQVRKAIEALINAATGGGDTSQFLLVSQARARLPIFPEILSADGRMIVTSPAAGSILVPPTVAFQHRGIFPMSTSDYSEPNRTFVTTASKTYHVRWDPTNGFRLRDLADVAYNPGVLAETATAFDSTYDDMLVARVTTNGANVATITNLANKHDLKGKFSQSHTFSNIAASDVSDHTLAAPIVIDWARTPEIMIGGLGSSGGGVAPTPLAGNVDVGVTAEGALVSLTTRYKTETAVQAFNPRAVVATVIAAYILIARA